MPLGEQAELVREIEIVRALAAEARAEIGAHEREDTLRFKQISEDTAAMRLSITAIENTITQKTELAIRVGWTLNWKAWAIAVGILGSLVGTLAYESGQLYGLHQAAGVLKP